jgi:hypothetical protein
MDELLNNEEYEKALRRFEEIFFAKKGTSEGAEAKELSVIILNYENIHFILK